MLAPVFSTQTDALLSHARTLCERRGAQLTELRRKVLGLVLESDRPTGAYDLLDQLRVHHKGAAPPTVYRALDFLLEQGLVHKVERLSAYVGCIHPSDEDDHHHAAQFLICKTCGQVTELEDLRVHRALVEVARKHGFRPTGSTMEVEGICAACATQAAAAG